MTSQPTDLAIPGKVSAAGLDLDPKCSWDEYVRAGQMLGQLDRAVPWMIGDWLNFGEWRFGEKYVQAASVTGLSPDRLRQLQWVASRFEQHRRRPELSVAHHAEVAARDPGVAEELLDQAQGEGWSVARLRRVRQGRPDDPRPECPTCGRPMPSA